MNRNGRNVRINLWATPKEKEQMDKLAEKYGLTKKCCCVSVVVLIQFSMQKERREKWSLP